MAFDLKGIFGVRDDKAAKLKRRAKLASERAEVEALDAHNDDWIAAYCADFDKLAELFEWRYEHWHATPAAKRACSGMWLANRDCLLDLLAMSNLSPDYPIIAPTTRADHTIAPVSPVALAWLIADAYKTKVTDLMRRKHPERENGIREIDRAARLAKIDSEVRKLDEEIAEIDSALDAVRKVVA